MVFTTLYSLALCGAALWMLSSRWEPVLNVAKNSLPPFEVRLDQGHLSTTLPEPVAYSDADVTIVVDTSGKTIDASNYEHAILISKTKGILKKSRFETREYLWAALPDFRVTTSDILDWLLRHKMQVLWGLFSFVALLILPLMWLVLIPVPFFVAVLLLIPGKIFGSLSYGQTLSIAFYAVTLPTYLQTYFAFHGPPIGGWIYAIYAGWATWGAIVAANVGKESGPPSIQEVPS